MIFTVLSLVPGYLARYVPRGTIFFYYMYYTQT
eukprot:SAG11_NODE_14507_length_609_cov_1.527451_1_plen_32_part_01